MGVRGITADFDRWRQAVQLTEEQEQLVLGSTLGNMSIFRRMISSTGGPSEVAVIEAAHVFANKDYVDWKYSFFTDLVGTPPSCRMVKQLVPSQPDFQSPMMCSFRTFGLPALRPLFDLCYSNNGKRKITPEWMEAIWHPIALAAWYMDSGTPLRKHEAGRTDRFVINITVPRSDINGAYIVQDYLLWDGMGIDAMCVSREAGAPGNIKSSQGHHSLRIIKKDEVTHFIETIKKYVVKIPSMRWKIEPFL